MKTQDSIRRKARFIARGWFFWHHPQASEEEADRYCDSEWRRYVHMVGLTPKEISALVLAREPIRPE